MNRRKQITETEDKLEDLISKHLRKNGWAYSCKGPGSLWLWVKEIEGARYAVSANVALHMQDSLDALSRIL